MIPGRPEIEATGQWRLPDEGAVNRPDSAPSEETTEAVREWAAWNTGDDGMRRIVVLLVLATVALVLFSGVALAVTKHCKLGVVCYGTKYRDTLYGTVSSDVIYGKGRGDTLKGFDGDDDLYGQGGSDKLLGGLGRDQLYGGSGDEGLAGGEGEDEYRFDIDGWGHDTITDTEIPDDSASRGNEVVFPPTVSDGLIIDLNSGEGPEVETSAGTVNWPGNVIDIVLDGSSGNDEITGNGVPNLILSFNGADHVEGGGGDDTIWVDDGSGDDTVDCGEGTDSVRYDTGDTVTNCES